MVKSYLTMSDEEKERLSLEELQKARGDLEKYNEHNRQFEEDMTYKNDWDWDKAQEAHNDVKYYEEQIKDIDGEISRKQQ